MLLVVIVFSQEPNLKSEPVLAFHFPLEFALHEREGVDGERKGRSGWLASTHIIRASLRHHFFKKIILNVCTMYIQDRRQDTSQG